MHKLFLAFTSWLSGNPGGFPYLPQFQFFIRYDSLALRNAKLDAHDAEIGPSALLNIRSGPPANTGGNGILLAQLVGNAAGFFGPAVGGVLTSNPITADSSADNTGTAAHYELTTSAATFVESGLCDLAGTDGVSIDNESIQAGQTVQMSGDWTKTAPNP